LPAGTPLALSWPRAANVPDRAPGSGAGSCQPPPTLSWASSVPPPVSAMFFWFSAYTSGE
jgi:hypothetical protein